MSLASVNTATADLPAVALGADAPRLGPLRVLVVDDSPSVRTAIAFMLRLECGHAVCEAGTQLEAVALLDAVDAVATDGFYPYRAGEATGPWGLALARLAREQGKRVVLVSGDPDVIEQAQWEGFQALRKPGGVLRVATALAEAEDPHC